MDDIRDENDRISWEKCFEYYDEKVNKKNIEFDKKEYLMKWLDNLKRVGEYFREYWCTFNLNVEQQNICDEIQNAPAEAKKDRIKYLLIHYMEKHHLGNINVYEMKKWDILRIESEIRKSN